MGKVITLLLAVLFRTKTCVTEIVLPIVLILNF